MLTALSEVLTGPWSACERVNQMDQLFHLLLGNLCRQDSQSCSQTFEFDNPQYVALWGLMDSINSFSTIIHTTNRVILNFYD